MHVFEGNDRARHVYEKAGFVREGAEHQALYRHGRHIDIHVMGMLRHEWHAQGRRRTWEAD